MCAHVYRFVWRSEVKIRCLPQLFSALKKSNLVNLILMCISVMVSSGTGDTVVSCQGGPGD